MVNLKNEILYDFKVERDWLTMPDGVRLAVTYYMPVARNNQEKFPVILEMLPYRKDDDFYIHDYERYSFFARRGFIGARVDVRGTGSSEGKMVPREYSQIELSDGEEVIRQLARLRMSNGSVGMLGQSWSANNALMLALRNPPNLKAIIIAHASDDLYREDVHYFDGIFHVDIYEAYMEAYNIIPRSPDYKIDDQYFRDRFDAYPWFLTYKKHQRDGSFWRRESARYHYDDLRIPTYIFGGLLDGYRDTVPRLLERANGPVRAEMGPYDHNFPNRGTPGPRHEWRYDAIRWYDRWLNGIQNGIEDEPRFSIFVRAGNPPDPQLKIAPGEWRYEDWPIKRTIWTTFYPSKGGLLETKKGKSSVETHKYLSGSGIEASGPDFWWGNLTGNVASSDKGGLIYDSEELKQAVEIIGYPVVQLRTAVDAVQADWIVRLEDVQPDGSVTLVTGAGINGAQRNSSVHPEALEPGQFYTLSFKLHFTTWTFQPGHKIRMSVTNAQFPMFWPTPYKMVMKLKVGDERTFIRLPVIPYEKRPAPVHVPPVPDEDPKDASIAPCGGDPVYSLVKHDRDNGSVSVEQMSETYFNIRNRSYYRSDKRYYETNEKDPANSRFLSNSEGYVKLKERTVFHRATIDMYSTSKSFHIKLTRYIFENSQLVRKKSWEEVIPRDFQ